MRTRRTVVGCWWSIMARAEMPAPRPLRGRYRVSLKGAHGFNRPDAHDESLLLFGLDERRRVALDEADGLLEDKGAEDGVADAALLAGAQGLVADPAAAEERVVRAEVPVARALCVVLADDDEARRRLDAREDAVGCHLGWGGSAEEEEGGEREGGEGREGAGAARGLRLRWAAGGRGEGLEEGADGQDGD